MSNQSLAALGTDLPFSHKSVVSITHEQVDPRPIKRKENNTLNNNNSYYYDNDDNDNDNNNNDD